MADFAQFLVDLIFQPGSSLKLIPVINGALLGLVAVLALLMHYSSLATIHIVVMTTLATGLLLSVNW